MNLLNKIKPVPQKLCQGNDKVVLGNVGKGNFSYVIGGNMGELALNAVELLKNRLAGIVDDKAPANGAVSIVVALSDEIPAEVEKNGDQAYSIEAKDNVIRITGYGEAGLYFAVITFLQCVSVENNVVYIPEMSLLDWPDLRTRGHFMECRYGSNLMTLADWKDLVDDMVAMKMNQLVVALYGCWCVQYDRVISEYVYIPVHKYPELKTNVIKHYYSPKNKSWINETVPTPMAEENFFGELVAYGKSVGVEIVPLWNCYGHNTIIPRMYPEVSARINGELSGHGLCVSCEETYDMLYSIFDQIIDEYLKPHGITSFHIGMDEVRDEIATDVNDLYKVSSPWCECDKCKQLSNEDKFLNHAIKLIKYLKSRGMKSVYIYSDMMTKIVNPANFKKILEENDLLDVTVIDWWTYTNHKEGLMFDTMYPELNMRSTVKPWNSYYHWNVTFDTVPNVQILCEMAKREGHVEGLQSYSAWDKSCDRNHVSMADFSWNFVGTGSVEDFRVRYAAREFGASSKEAEYALGLIDKITAEKNSYTKFGELKEDEESIGNGTILQHELSYYFYSYVRTGKDYPRNFPGDGMAKILEKRDMYEKRLNEIADMSREALAIFEKLSTDPECNTELAKRFACETENYLCLAEDYLALLSIHDIAENGAEDAADSIARIANGRKKSRLALMNRIENVKEAFLIPSHLRNQSIFMQLFADIEAYVKTTGNAKLNIMDLRNIGSEVFFSLR